MATTLKKEEKPLQNAYDTFKSQLELDKVSAQNEISNANKMSKQYMDNYLKYYGMQGSGMGQSAYANLSAQNTQNIANVNSQYSKQLSDYRTAFNENLKQQAANDLQTLSKEDQQSYIDDLRGQSGVNEDTISNIQSQANAVNYQRDEEQRLKTEAENKQLNQDTLDTGLRYANTMSDEQWNSYIENLSKNPNVSQETIAQLQNERGIYSENKRLKDEEEATYKSEQDKKQANSDAMEIGSEYAFTMTDENWAAYLDRLSKDPNITDETLYHLQEQREIYLEDKKATAEKEANAKAESERNQANSDAWTRGQGYAQKYNDQKWNAYLERLKAEGVDEKVITNLQDYREAYGTNKFENSLNNAISGIQGAIDEAKANGDKAKQYELSQIFNDINNASNQEELDAALKKWDDLEKQPYSGATPQELGSTSGTGSQYDPLVFDGLSKSDLKDLADSGKLKDGTWVQYENWTGKKVNAQVVDGKLKNEETCIVSGSGTESNPYYSDSIDATNLVKNIAEKARVGELQDGNIVKDRYGRIYVVQNGKVQQYKSMEEYKKQEQQNRNKGGRANDFEDNWWNKLVNFFK